MNEREKFNPAGMDAYLEGWNKGLHQVTRTQAPSTPDPE
jgi:hypothetical protein